MEGYLKKKAQGFLGSYQKRYKSLIIFEKNQDDFSKNLNRFFKIIGSKYLAYYGSHKVKMRN
jgi:hypothetical protein